MGKEITPTQLLDRYLSIIVLVESEEPSYTSLENRIG